MNRFEQAYLNIINEWNSNLLLEANLKSLIPMIQKVSLRIYGKNTYQELSDEKKQDFRKYINNYLNWIERQVNAITDNKQYQSWIYGILKDQENVSDILPKLKSILIDFEKLCKRPDLKPQQKNIQNYSTLNELNEFIDNFKTEHKLQTNIYKNLKKVYKNSEFTVHFIVKDQYEECNKLFGGTEVFNTGWCVAKNEEHFNNYIYAEPDKYNGYFLFIKDNKPFALLHYGSGQFKDTSDDTLKDNNPNIIDCLYHIDNSLNLYVDNRDLSYYKEFIEEKWLQANPNKSKEEFIAYYIGGKYNKETNTIDCKGNSIRFKDEWLDKNGTFNFNFINTSETLNYMFMGCKKLRTLPNNFTIPTGTKYCIEMFDGCINLEKLPDKFAIPESVIDCTWMFRECKKLKKLPDKFTIPSSVRACPWMFTECDSLEKLPDNFSIPKFSIHNDIFKYTPIETTYDIEDLLK